MFAEKFLFFQIGPFRSSVRLMAYNPGTVFFIPNPWLGLIFWAGLFSAPRLGLFALLGLGVGTLLKKLLNLNDVFSLGGGIKANALLTAVATGWLLSAQSLPLWAELSVAAVAAAIAGLVTAAIMFAMSSIAAVAEAPTPPPPSRKYSSARALSPLLAAS